MKIENTVENKARFFALYWGLPIVRHKDWRDQVQNATNAWNKEFPDYTGYNNYYLSLRTISSLTNEEIEECARLMQFSAIDHKWNRTAIIQGANIGALWSVCSDYLRSIGILIPFMGLSTETIIEYGWAKINNPQ